MPMTSLNEMTVKDAVRTAKEESGLTAEQIARGLKVSISVIKRYLKEDDPYCPSLEMLPRLCAVLGNTLLLEWASTQVKHESTSQKKQMLLSLTNAITILEETDFLIRQTESLSCWEEQAIISALDEAERECDRIRELLPQRKGCDYCTRNKLWCPLWKFWKHWFSKRQKGQR